MFGRLAARVNDVGLLAEEVDAATGGFLGNFPQAFSHIGLAGSAALLWPDRTRADGARHRRDRSAR
jgi:alpha,alpha-trehalase